MGGGLKSFFLCLFFVGNLFDFDPVGHLHPVGVAWLVSLDNSSSDEESLSSTQGGPFGTVSFPVVFK